MSDISTVREILVRLISLLRKAHEIDWANALDSFRAHCDATGDNPEKTGLFSDILRIYGGMGSFSDLVLYREGEVLLTENNELDNLRKELFEAVKRAR